MFQQLHQSTHPLEVLTMFEPHRLHQQFLQAAYALVVPLSSRCRTATQQPVSGSENQDHCLVYAQKGAGND